MCQLFKQVARFNKFCETGVDEDYHRGESGGTRDPGVRWCNSFGLTVR